MNLNQHNRSKYYFNTADKLELSKFTKKLVALITARGNNVPIVILCIGTDRATGDSLGPIIGYKLQNFLINNNAVIYGTLSHPIHAKNIEETIQLINKDFNDPLIIAIDACLGKMSHIGMIHLGEGPILPGAGVNKKLPPVGDIFITGIVNFSGFMDMMILQNTRLNTVMEMADFIVLGIKRAFTKINYDQNKAI